MAEDSRAVPAFPPVLNVEVTNDCNLDCPMCARTTSMTRPVQHMSEDVFRRVVDEANEHGVSKLWLHMFGESLLHPRIYDFIAYAASKPNIKRVALSTNVTPLTAANSRRLLESGLHHLILAIDAHSAATYERVRGFDFDRVLANARGFLELHRELQSRMTVNVTIIDMGIKRHGEIEAFREEWERFTSDRVDILVKTLINFGGMVDTKQFAGEDDDEGPDHGTGRRKSCSKLWDSLTVQSNGQVVACCYDVNGQMPYGDVTATGLLGAWQGQPIQVMRDQHARTDFSALPLCGVCDKTLRKPKGEKAARTIPLAATDAPSDAGNRLLGMFTRKR